MSPIAHNIAHSKKQSIESPSLTNTSHPPHQLYYTVLQSQHYSPPSTLHIPVITYQVRQHQSLPSTAHIHIITYLVLLLSSLIQLQSKLLQQQLPRSLSRSQIVAMLSQSILEQPPETGYKGKKISTQKKKKNWQHIQASDLLSVKTNNHNTRCMSQVVIRNLPIVETNTHTGNDMS